MNQQIQKHITPIAVRFHRARTLHLRTPASVDPQYLPAKFQLIANHLIQQETLDQ